MAKELPQRSCVACGKTADKDGLLRFVLSPEGVAVPDLKGKLPGRGSYTCLNPSCVCNAVSRGRFSRGFKQPVPSGNGDAVVASIRQQAVERIAAYIALANKGGKVISGADTVRESLRKPGRVGMLFLASDLAGESERKFGFLAREAGIETVALLDKDRLGQLLGKEFRGVVAVEAGAFADTLHKELDRYRYFFDGGSVIDEQDPIG